MRQGRSRQSMLIVSLQRAAFVACAATWCVASGCRSEIPVRYDGTPIASQGGSSELVFHGQSIASLVTTGNELGRRDDNLGVRSSESRFDQDYWPDPRRPSLDRARRLYISDRPGNVTYFREQAVRESLNINGGTVVIP